MPYLQIITNNSALKKGSKTTLGSFKNISISASFKEALRNIAKNPVDLILVDADLPEFSTPTWLKKIYELKDFQNFETALVIISETGNPVVEQLLRSRNRRLIQDIYFYHKKSFQIGDEGLKFFMEKNFESLKLKRQIKFLNYEKENYFSMDQNKKTAISPHISNHWGLNGRSEESLKLRQIFQNCLVPGQNLLICSESEKLNDELVSSLSHWKQQHLKKSMRLYEVDFKKIQHLFQESIFDFQDLPRKQEGGEKLILYFKNIEFANWQIQPLIISLFQNLKNKRNQDVDSIVLSSRIDQEKLVGESYLRQDLLYALRVHILDILPFKKRKNDWLEMLQGLIQESATKFNKTISVDEMVMEAILQHNWKSGYSELPDYISELFQFTSKTYSADHRKKIFINKELMLKFLTDNQHLQAHPLIRESRASIGNLFIKINEQEQMNLFELLDNNQPSLYDLEKHYISYVVDKTNGNMTESSRILQVSRKTLYEKVKRYEKENADLQRKLS